MRPRYFFFCASFPKRITGISYKMHACEYQHSLTYSHTHTQHTHTHTHTPTHRKAVCFHRGGDASAAVRELFGDHAALHRAEAKAGDRIAIFGCGPIGLGMVLWAVDRGCKDVIALDLSDERLERARALGAHTINPSREDVAARIKEIHGVEKVFGREKAGTDAYIDAAGGPRILSDVVAMAKTHARYVITAAYMKPIELPAGPMLTTEMTITTAVGYPTEMPDVVAAMPRLKDKIEGLISHKLPFARVLEGLEIAATPQSAKVMIGFDGADS